MKKKIKKIDDPKNPFYGKEKVTIYTNMKNKNPSEGAPQKPPFER